MNQYAIFVDSSVDIDRAFVAEHGLHIVPMCYTIGEENREAIRLEDDAFLKDFYDNQRKGDLTHTSQVTSQKYIDSFSPVLAEGKDILYISLSGGLTNSRDSIHIAKMELKENYPNVHVYAVDSLSATGGVGILAEQAVYNREKGMSVEENAKVIEELTHKVCHIFMVEDLMYLKRGGRIPAVSAVIGTALNLKPILVIDDKGKLSVVSKQRGKKHAMNELMERFEKSRDTSFHRVSLIHADAPDVPAHLAEEVKKLDEQAEITTTMLCPVIGAHTGPGMAAIIYFGDRAKIM